MFNILSIMWGCGLGRTFPKKTREMWEKNFHDRFYSYSQFIIHQQTYETHLYML
jgi:hypothetical protein